MAPPPRKAAPQTTWSRPEHPACVTHPIRLDRSIEASPYRATFNRHDSLCIPLTLLTHKDDTKNVQSCTYDWYDNRGVG